MKMATSPTPSLDSIRGTNSIESYGEHNGYLSDSPLTLSGSSPPVSDSAICDEFTTNGNSNTTNQHHPISASVSSASSASSTSSSSSSPLSSSGLSGCGSSNSSVSSGSSSGGGGSSGGSSGVGTNSTNANSNGANNSGPGVIGSGKGSPCGTLISNGNVLNVTTANSNSAPRCTACKSKQSDAVAKCFDCVSFLCANCVTAHQFMHCFNDHNVCLIKGFDTQSNNTGNTNSSTGSNNNSNSNNSGVGQNSNGNNSNNTTTAEYKLSSSLTMMLQQQQQQQHQIQQFQKQQPLSQLSKIVLNSHATSAAAAAVFGGDNHGVTTAHQQHQTQQENSNGTNGCGEELFNSLISSGSSGIRSQPLYCHRHKHELLKFSCRSCCTLVCKECVILEHSSGLHDIEHVQDTMHGACVPVLGGHHTTPETVVQTVIDELRTKVDEIEGNVNSSVAKIKMQYQKAHNEVNETYQFFCSMLDERKQELLKELETLYNAKITSNNNVMQRAKELAEKTAQTCNAIERSPKQHNIAEVLLVRKTFESQLHTALQEMQLPFELEFMSNYQSIQAGVRNTFGYIRASNSDMALSSLMVGGGKQPPIARPSQSTSIGSNNSTTSSSNSITGCSAHLPGGLGLAASHLLDSAYANGTSSLLGRNNSNGGNHHHLSTVGGGSGVNSNITHTFDEILSKQYQANGTGGATPFVVGVTVNPYEKWSNGGSDNLFASSDPFSNSQLLTSLSTNGTSNGGVTIGAGQNALSALSVAGTGSTSTDSLMDLTSKLLTASMYPPKSQIKRHKMIYHCKFGEFGVMEGQFTEPSGVAVNAQNDIIVADTNNHRIQIFDKEGRFKFQFGECGKRDSQLLYPNRVAVVRTSGDIIVTERSPTHQIQIYNQYGQFVRKFGANILQHPRGVTVDNKGRIIVVECKVMRVIIFDQNGNVLHKFGCSKHLEFPNGVVVNDKQEIFISDNRAHCVKVFNYEGQFLRQIGGEGVTNYPIGVGINANGDILIADNHNNFNLTIFTQDGQLISALESKVKHAQCFDVSLMDDGSVVLASKDYRLYIYRYVQVPPNGP